MNHQATKICKQYLEQIRHVFPSIGKRENTFLCGFKESVNEYLESRPSSKQLTMEELYRQFGSPQHIVSDYFANTGASQLMGSIQRSQRTRRLRLFFSLVFLGLLLVCGVAIKENYASLESLTASNVFYYNETTDNTQNTTIYEDDDGYLIAEIDEANGALLANTVTGSKTITYYTNDEAAWSITINGTFICENDSICCTYSSANIEVYNSAWAITVESTEEDGASASATFTAVLYQNKIAQKSLTQTITLTCASQDEFF